MAIPLASSCSMFSGVFVMLIVTQERKKAERQTRLLAMGKG